MLVDKFAQRILSKSAIHQSLLLLNFKAHISRIIVFDKWSMNCRSHSQT